MTLHPQIAVILSTYQRPEHLHRSLLSLAFQLRVEGQFEVVVTDDGSTDDTAELVRRFAQSADFPVVFTSHEHRGFQLARCRNNGVLASSARIYFFPTVTAFSRPLIWRSICARRRGVAWSGDCLRLDEASTGQINEAVIASGAYRAWLHRKELRRIRQRWIKDRFYEAIGHPKKPRLIGCNIAVWRDDFERINGFDECYVGWGCEDDDLAERLRGSGVRIKSILGSTRVFHMWHPLDPSRPLKWRDGGNVQYLSRENKPVHCIVGLHDRP